MSKSVQDIAFSAFVQVGLLVQFVRFFKSTKKLEIVSDTTVKVAKGIFFAFVIAELACVLCGAKVEAVAWVFAMHPIISCIFEILTIFIAMKPYSTHTLDSALAWSGFSIVAAWILWLHMGGSTY